jgi:DNA modification methylase
MSDPNLLYYGDNLDVLRRHVKDESVEIVYLDPPFNSNATYNLLFEEHGEKAAAQVQAFTDSWEWNTDARQAYEEIVEAGGKVADTMRAFRTMLGASDMLAYLAMMAPRLIELDRVLKPTGSLYLHCDPTASHYLKLLLDAVFGPKGFRNEIAWHYSGWNKRLQGWFERRHDVLLFYAKGTPKTQTFNSYARPWASPAEYVRVRKQKVRTDEAGREYVLSDKGGGQRVHRYLDDAMATGAYVDDVWDLDKLNNSAREALGYPTQKPLALLERIIKASSNPGDLVLDPFCGCGTTVDAAQALDRRWVGIDITHLAIGLIKHRLIGRYGPEIAATYRTIGEPTTVDDARVLAQEDKFQFQAWALGLVGARVAGSAKKGGDKGVDGRLYFHDGGSDTRQIVFSVKGGEHLVPNFVRDLRGVIERDKAEIGVLISFEESTAGMRAEAAEAGFYESPWGKHPRIQLRTVGELLAGKGIDYPHVTGANVTHRKAARVGADQPEALELFGRAAEEPFTNGGGAPLGPASSVGDESGS